MLLHFCRSPGGGAFFSCSKMSLFHLKTCTPVRGTPWSTAWGKEGINTHTQHTKKKKQGRSLHCDPAGHLQECFLGNRRKCFGECFRSAFGGFPTSAPESAPESARKLGVPQGVLPRVPFLILFQGKALLGPGALPIFRALSRALSGALFGNPPKAVRKHSPGHFRRFPKKHSCKWPAGSQSLQGKTLLQKARKGRTGKRSLENLLRSLLRVACYHMSNGIFNRTRQKHLIRSQKGPTKPKKSHEQHQRIFWTIRGGYRSLPSRTRVLRQIAPESSPERSAKSLSHSFFCGAFSVPKFRRHFCLKRYKTRHTPEKRDRIKNPRHGQHPERDQNEIGTRYEVA